MIKYLIYFGEELNDIPVFRSALNITQWTRILDILKSKTNNCLHKKIVKYYKLDSIQTIESINDQRQMNNLSDLKLEIMDKNFLKCEYNEESIEYILPDYEYFNKQIHEVQIINYQNISIYFDKYYENGNCYYNIYTILNEKNAIPEFISIIRNIII